jgi:hypothetical protein
MLEETVKFCPYKQLTHLPSYIPYVFEVCTQLWTGFFTFQSILSDDMINWIRGGCCVIPNQVDLSAHVTAWKRTEYYLQSWERWNSVDWPYRVENGVATPDHMPPWRKDENVLSICFISCYALTATLLFMYRERTGNVSWCLSAKPPHLCCVEVLL